ncbi:MAG: hypothetical protein LBS07_01405 [Prevotellaceae bacterium]|jgi:hypothetical protein|nr:hypothetical protein [Prevotellaceae bacterium]
MTERKNFSWRLLLGAVMVFIYLGMAFMLAFTNLFDFNMTYRIIFASLFFLYGLFRGYRLWKSGM